MSGFTITCATVLTGLDGLASSLNLWRQENEIGPASNYQSLGDFLTWICALAMLLGRLEVFTLVVLFTPTFWRK